MWETAVLLAETLRPRPRGSVPPGPQAPRQLPFSKICEVGPLSTWAWPALQALWATRLSSTPATWKQPWTCSDL